MKHFIIVAGVDYHPIAEGKTPTDFYKYCEKHRDKLVLKYPSPEELTFYMVDIRRGKVHKQQYLYDQVAKIRNKQASVEHASYDLVTRACYSDLRKDGGLYFHPRGKNIISKWTIYGLIEDIGRDHPGTLEECSVFSHAYWDGPIILDSLSSNRNYNDYVTPSTYIDVATLGYDPNDYDFRISDITNFYLVRHFNGRALLLKNAFARTGMIKIWGCSFPKMLNTMMSIIRKNKAFKTSGVADTQIFTFAAKSFTKDQVAHLNNQIDTKYAWDQAINIPFIEIRRFMCLHMTGTYAYAAAVGLNINVQAALPATYADISPYFKISSLVEANVTFYKNYLGIQTDAEGLNYGIYRPDLTCP
jgi:hypothetical protein